MGKLTTQVIDVAKGRAARGMTITLYRVGGPMAQLLGQFATDEGGSTRTPLLSGEDLTAGQYRLVLEMANYFRSQGAPLPDPFLDEVMIDFGIADGRNDCHVMLQVTPWSYTMGRGG
jgi:5-hydroxyisourate hydrolase